MPEEKKSGSLLFQIAILFVVGAALIWGITTYSLHKRTIDTVTYELIVDMRQTALDTESYIRQYPASDWLLEYWYENRENMDIEYDAGYRESTKTKAKCLELMQRNPGFQIVKDEYGFVLGGLEDSGYREYEIQMDQGSRIFLYTDGLPEASNKEGEMFGLERALTELNNAKDETPKQIVDRMTRAVHEFVEGREAFDDLTLMCLVYNGKKDE